ncbi:MAG: hypothetical protein PHX93_05635 [Candidatus Peribacteraceae bacterium]|nr:hypothetical protein [Candidatus Peribacteraceae bacterium]
MKQYQSFVFHSCSFDPKAGTIELHSSLDDAVRFTETLVLPTPTPYALHPTPALLQILHLIGGISYYKTCCPKKMEIRSGSLAKEQADFWNTVYTKGLGEFFYRNQIDFRGLIHFPTTNSQQPTTLVPNSDVRRPTSSPTPYALRPTPPRLLVPLGGGKDSTVTAELLKKAGYDVTLFRIGKHPLIEQTATIAGLPLLTVERHLAPELFALNAEGALNGHVPITAYLSILSVLLAEMYGFDAVIMSNERSANEGNVEYLGQQINHQWSKSLEFERMYRKYLRTTGSPVEYFSLLRPWSELRIVQEFTAMPQYFASITSCNANWRLHPKSEIPSPKSPGGKWCGKCPKCAFAFAMFAAFLPKKTLLEIFGKNLFDEPTLQPFYRNLLGLEGFKPFECVGTPEETKAAFLLAHERGDLEDSKAMQLFLKEVQPEIKDGKKLIADALTPSADHCVPDSFRTPSFLPLIEHPEVLSPQS